MSGSEDEVNLDGDTEESAAVPTDVEEQLLENPDSVGDGVEEDMVVDLTGGPAIKTKDDDVQGFEEVQSKSSRK